jgi:hypothetical protein
MIAQNVIASAPFGHALAIQNNDIAPTDRTTRNAAMEGGSQSATCNRAIPLTGIMSGGSTTPTSPFSARAMPSMPWAALSAKSRCEGVSALKRVRARTAEQQAWRNSAGVFAEPDASGENRSRGSSL